MGYKKVMFTTLWLVYHIHDPVVSCKRHRTWTNPILGCFGILKCKIGIMQLVLKQGEIYKLRVYSHSIALALFTEDDQPG
jgi:hypothetical protein